MAKVRAGEKVATSDGIEMVSFRSYAVSLQWLTVPINTIIPINRWGFHSPRPS